MLTLGKHTKEGIFVPLSEHIDIVTILNEDHNKPPASLE